MLPWQGAEGMSPLACAKGEEKKKLIKKESRGGDGGK